MNKINEKLKILICCHKKSELPEDPEGIFLPIHVGAALSQGGGLNLQRDDQVNGETCDNISAKNGSYCELTAMYWAWKNIKKLYPNLEYIGLNHYRRYFSFDEKDILFDVINRPERDIKNYKVNTKKLSALLKKGFTIITKPLFFPFPVSVHYMVCHNGEDFRELRRVIHDICPEYDEVFYNVLMRRNSLSPNNMFVMKWEQYESYCSWLFNILSELEKRVNIDTYSVGQKRVFGYLAERLFNVWLSKNNVKVKKLTIFAYRNDLRKKSILKLCLNRLRCFVTIRLIRSPFKHIRDWSWTKG